MILDVAGILAGIAAILAAWWSRKAKTSAQTAADQTNGPLKAQAGVLDLILDGQRSLGHQLGEVRTDMGRMDERLTAEVAQLRAAYNSPPPAAGDQVDERRGDRGRQP